MIGFFHSSEYVDVSWSSPWSPASSSQSFPLFQLPLPNEYMMVASRRCRPCLLQWWWQWASIGHFVSKMLRESFLGHHWEDNKLTKLGRCDSYTIEWLLKYLVLLDQLNLEDKRRKYRIVQWYHAMGKEIFFYTRCCDVTLKISVCSLRPYVLWRKSFSFCLIRVNICDNGKTHWQYFSISQLSHVGVHSLGCFTFEGEDWKVPHLNPSICWWWTSQVPQLTCKK